MLHASGRGCVDGDVEVGIEENHERRNVTEQLHLSPPTFPQKKKTPLDVTFDPLHC